MQKFENKLVRVSETATYYLCPRLVYYNRKGTPQVCDAGVRASIFKSISYGLPDMISSCSPQSVLEELIQRSGYDAMAIYGERFKGIIEMTCKEAMERVPVILQGIEYERQRLGDDTLMRLLSPAYAALPIYSERLRLSGVIDRVANIKDEMMPIIISASVPPESGIYLSDRVRLAAYAMLLSERSGIDCGSGAIEYVTGWCLRQAEVRYEDKMRALYARNRILEMDWGRMPEASRGKWCGRCGHFNSCNVKVSLLDRVFKNKKA